MYDQPGVSPAKELWQEVLLRAVEDALFGPRHVQKRATKIILCKEARDYLTQPSRDLSMVCNLAGLDMQAVIDRMRVRIAKAPAPEELASERRRNRAST